MNTLLISQIFGAFGIVALCLGYISIKKTRYLTWQIVCNVFYMCQYLILGVYPAAAINIITFSKSGWFLFFEKQNKTIPQYAMIATLVVTVLVAPFVYNGTLFSIIPVILSCGYTIITWQKNLKLTYALAAVMGVIWVWYNFSVGAYAIGIGNIFEIITCGIGFYRLTKTNYTPPVRDN